MTSSGRRPCLCQTEIDHGRCSGSRDACASHSVRTEEAGSAQSSAQATLHVRPAWDTCSGMHAGLPGVAWSCNMGAGRSPPWPGSGHNILGNRAGYPQPGTHRAFLRPQGNREQWPSANEPLAVVWTCCIIQLQGILSNLCAWWHSLAILHVVLQNYTLYTAFQLFLALIRGVQAAISTLSTDIPSELMPLALPNAPAQYSICTHCTRWMRPVFQLTAHYVRIAHLGSHRILHPRCGTQNCRVRIWLSVDAGITAQPGGFNVSSATIQGLTQGAATLGDVVSGGESAAASLYHYGVQGFDNIRSQYLPPSEHVLRGPRLPLIHCRHREHEAALL